MNLQFGVIREEELLENDWWWGDWRRVRVVMNANEGNSFSFICVPVFNLMDLNNEPVASDIPLISDNNKAFVT